MMDTNMEYIEFKTDEETLEKLKEIGILTKTKTIADISKILYKRVNSDKSIESFTCKVIGYSHKENPKNCINSIYENLRIEVDNRTIDINIDYLKDMQKKSWGAEKESLEI